MCQGSRDGGPARCAVRSPHRDQRSGRPDAAATTADLADAIAPALCARDLLELSHHRCLRAASGQHRPARLPPVALSGPHEQDPTDTCPSQALGHGPVQLGKGSVKDGQVNLPGDAH